MTTLHEAAQQALEALEAGPDVDPIFAGETEVALRAALEQPEQEQAEPVEIKPPNPEGATQCIVRWFAETPAGWVGAWDREALEQFAHPPRRETEQEPVTNNPDPYHLSRILHELAGSASMCWDHVDRAGVFQSTQAADVVAAAIAEIRQRMKDAPPRREWRGLKEWEINDGLDQLPTEDVCSWSFRKGVYFAEAALKEKNHD